MPALAHAIIVIPPPAQSGPTWAEVLGGYVFHLICQPATSTTQAVLSSRIWADHQKDAT